MVFFGAELVRVQHNESYSDVWLSAEEVFSQCTKRLTIHNYQYMKQDIGAGEYNREKPFRFFLPYTINLVHECLSKYPK
jgi:hypothetical protein